MTQKFFITSTGTGQGKTLVTSALCWQLTQQKKSVGALKPIISGYDTADAATSDSGVITRSLGLEVGAEKIASISPWRFHAPLSPDIAAKKEGKTLDLEEISQFCKTALSQDIQLVEGAGGYYSPLSETATNADLIVSLGYPVIVVSNSYLGCISPLLATIECINVASLTIAAIVLNEAPHPEWLPSEVVSASLLPHLLPETPLIKIKKLEATDELWKACPDLTAELSL